MSFHKIGVSYMIIIVTLNIFIGVVLVGILIGQYNMQHRMAIKVVDFLFTDTRDALLTEYRLLLGGWMHLLVFYQMVLILLGGLGYQLYVKTSRLETPRTSKFLVSITTPKVICIALGIIIGFQYGVYEFYRVLMTAISNAEFTSAGMFLCMYICLLLSLLVTLVHLGCIVTLVKGGTQKCRVSGGEGTVACGPSSSAPGTRQPMNSWGKLQLKASGFSAFVKRHRIVLVLLVYSMGITVAYSHLYWKHFEEQRISKYIDISRDINHAWFYMRILNDYHAGTVQEVVPNLEALAVTKYHSVLSSAPSFASVMTQENKVKFRELQIEINKYERTNPESRVAESNRDPFWKERESHFAD